jgi:glycosyltransferase involved in cell wall biosynthesis
MASRLHSRTAGSAIVARRMKVLLFANTDWYLWNFRRNLVETLCRQNWEVCLVTPPGSYHERFRALGARWLELRMCRDGTNPIRELMVVASLCSIYRREHPDIVHHFTLKSVIHGSLAAWLAGIDMRVNAIAGLGYIFSSGALKARVLRPVVRLLLRVALSGRSSATIFQNPDDAEAFTRSGLSQPGRTWLIRGSGVDTACFKAVPRLTNSPCRVLLAARLLWSKGVGEYVAAARALKPGLPVEFLLAGAPDKGSPDAIPDAQLESWRAEGHVQFLGHVDDMSGLLKTVDIVVLPSSYAEGVPRILLEGAAASAALIATDRPGCREVIEHNVSGLLIPSGDSSALLSALRTLILDPAARVRLGQAARRKMEMEFEESRVIAATIGVYDQLLSARDPMRSDS